MALEFLQRHKNNYVYGDASLNNGRQRFKAFVNPMFIVMLIGTAVGIFEIEIPVFLVCASSVAGDCMSPLAMLLTGVIVAKMDLKKVLSIKCIYAVSFLRLFVFPILFIGVFYILPAPKSIVACTICSLAMPLGLNTIVIPEGYGNDTSVAAGMAIVSHLLTGLTIPLVFALMMRII